MSQNRYRALWVLFVVQALCTLYFVGDALGNLGGADSEEPDGLWDLPEYVATFALLISTGFTGIELRRAMHREARMRNQLAVASGAFGEVLERYFDDWTLTEAERAVAMLAIKGFFRSRDRGHQIHQGRYGQGAECRNLSQGRSERASADAEPVH